MKNLLLTLFSLAAICNYSTSQTLYQNPIDQSPPLKYNPGLNAQNEPVIVFDDVNISSSILSGSDSVAITNVKFGIQRAPNAPAVTLKLYYSPADPAFVDYGTRISIPPVFIGAVNLPANVNNTTDIAVSIGDSITPIFKVKTTIGLINQNYATLFLGLSFSVGGPNTNGWKIATASQSYNDNHIWLYDSSANLRLAATFDNPPTNGTFNLQVFGYSISSSLPVTLAAFKGEHAGAVNFLSWITATEQNNKGFEIQRSSDGNRFSTISFVSSKTVSGNSTSRLSYQFTDNEPLSGDNYYRLKQVDVDGKATISAVVLIKGNNVNNLVITGIYPNPAGKAANLIIGATTAQKITVIVSDFAGKIVLQQATTTIAGSNKISMDVSKLSPGTYSVKIVSATRGQFYTSKLLKK